MRSPIGKKLAIVALTAAAILLFAPAAFAGDTDRPNDSILDGLAAGKLMEEVLMPAWRAEMVQEAKGWHKKGWCALLDHDKTVRVAVKEDICREIEMAEAVQKSFTRTLLAALSPAAAGLA